MEFFKLIGVFLAVPFITMFLYFIVLTEQIAQAYGTSWMVVAISVTLILPAVGFAKDFWSGIITLSVIVVCWAMFAQNII